MRSALEIYRLAAKRCILPASDPSRDKWIEKEVERLESVFKDLESIDRMWQDILKKHEEERRKIEAKLKAKQRECPHEYQDKFCIYCEHELRECGGYDG